jgi:hypothetical protein
VRSDHQEAIDLLGHDRTTSNFPTVWSRTDSLATNDGKVVPFELDASNGQRAISQITYFWARHLHSLLNRVDAVRFHGIRELELRCNAGGLWGLNPFISLDLDFMMLSEESKESQDATIWWNFVRRFPDGLLGGAGMGP